MSLVLPVLLALLHGPTQNPAPVAVEAAKKAVTTFHIGNRLTEDVMPWMEPLAAAGGHTLRFHRFTIPDAPTDQLWDHPGSGLGDTQYQAAFQTLAPVDHIFTQPSATQDRDIANEADYSSRFFEAARAFSPNLQAWLYIGWPTAKLDDAWSKGVGALMSVPGTHRPSTTYSDAVGNFMVYGRAVRDRINRTYKGKPVQLVPAGPALAVLKEWIDAGKVPGMTDLFEDCFADDLHLNSKGAYLVALVHYACVFRESPVGKFGSMNSGLTGEQARLMQEIAARVTGR